MNWTAQDEAKWAELDARRKKVTNQWRANLGGILQTISQEGGASRQAHLDAMIRHAAELRDALEPYDDRVAKQECSQSNQADDGWIEWNGGEQPIPNGSIADVKYRDGTVQLLMPIPGGGPSYDYVAYNWSHNGLAGDIIAYRPVK